jgi:hypothetical protein
MWFLHADHAGEQHDPNDDGGDGTISFFDGTALA